MYKSFLSVFGRGDIGRLENLTQWGEKKDIANSKGIAEGEGGIISRLYLGR